MSAFWICLICYWLFGIVFLALDDLVRLKRDLTVGALALSIALGLMWPIVAVMLLWELFDDWKDVTLWKARR